MGAQSNPCKCRNRTDWSKNCHWITIEEKQIKTGTKRYQNTEPPQFQGFQYRQYNMVYTWSQSFQWSNYKEKQEWKMQRKVNVLLWAPVYQGVTSTPTRCDYVRVKPDPESKERKAANMPDNAQVVPPLPVETHKEHPAQNSHLRSSSCSEKPKARGTCTIFVWPCWGQGLHPVHHSEWQTSQENGQTRLIICCHGARQSLNIV